MSNEEYGLETHVRSFKASTNLRVRIVMVKPQLLAYVGRRAVISFAP